MWVDMGFWNEKGEYVEDIQELTEMEAMMYKLKVKGTVFTMPKTNIKLLAMIKAQDFGELEIVKLETDQDAIDYLNSKGIEVL